MASLTFVYSDSQAVIGPLSDRFEPGSYDLCAEHATRITVPKDWELIRLPGEYHPAQPTADDLATLAEAIRSIGLGQKAPSQPRLARRKGHLAVLADVD